MRDDVAVGVPGEPARVLELDPAEHERHAVLERVRVDPIPTRSSATGGGYASRTPGKRQVVTCGLGGEPARDAFEVGRPSSP